MDADKERSTTLLAIALMKNNLWDEAQKVLESYLKRYGDSGVVLTNLAKVFAEKGKADEPMQTLWKALTVDPNQENAFEWWCALYREQEGEDSLSIAIEKVAQVPGSWLPQLWQARRLLEQKKIDSAITIYRKVLEIAPESEFALMMISGDLGNNGYLVQMLDLVLPFYKPEEHHMAGLNLIQACIRLGEKETGLKICDSVEHLQRNDLKQHLAQLRIQLDEIG